MAEKERNQGKGQTGTATLEPETHQTQATTGSPQAGGTASSQTGGTSTSRTGGTSSSQTGETSSTSAQQGGTTTSGSTGRGSTAGSQTGGTNMSRTSPGTSSTGMPRRGPLVAPTSLLGNPFGMMRSLVDQMDRFFDDFLGLGSGAGRGRPSGLANLAGAGTDLWYPQVEVSEREGNLVVCADLPGMKKEDVRLELLDDRLILEGERRQEQERNEQGWYRSERSYGRFYRAIPLPDGVSPDQAKANFKDGVLEVTIPLPKQEQQQQQGRRIEIQ